METTTSRTTPSPGAVPRVQPHHADENSPEWARSRGLRLTLYSRSLGVVMGLIFVFSWLAQSIAGRSAFNEQQLSQLQDPVSWTGYVVSSDFWNRT